MRAAANNLSSAAAAAVIAQCCVRCRALAAFQSECGLSRLSIATTRPTRAIRTAGFALTDACAVATVFVSTQDCNTEAGAPRQCERAMAGCASPGIAAERRPRCNMVRTPGVEPGSQAWGACMIPLHYVRHATSGIFTRFATPRHSCGAPGRAVATCSSPTMRELAAT